MTARAYDYEPWSPSLATEALRREVYRAETRKFFASPEYVAKLRAGLALIFDSEDAYVRWCHVFLSIATTPWRGEETFFG